MSFKGWFLLFFVLISSGGLLPLGQHVLVDEDKLFCSLCYSFGLEIMGVPLWDVVIWVKQAYGLTSLIVIIAC